MNNRAPFRADVVGSLLRPPPLASAREAYRAKTIDANQLRTIEDRCIREAVEKQEALGLRAVTDGEFRRSWWHLDFLAGLDGVERVAGAGRKFSGVRTRGERVVVTGKVAFGRHPMLEHFRFLRETATALPKMTIPAPSVLHFRGGRDAISREVYPDLEAFFSDTAEAYRAAIAAFHDAGCRYLQFDDTAWAYLCSQKDREALRERGDDPDQLQQAYARTINQALAEQPEDMVVTTHVCRGNYRSSWFAEGGYEPVAELLLGGTAYDGFFLEYDTERAGGFQPLRFLPKGNKRVVLGLLTTKHGSLETVDQIRSRIDEASAFAGLDQLCLSPQCGFASTEEGNLLESGEQWRKLERIVETADRVWGGG